MIEAKLNSHHRHSDSLCAEQPFGLHMKYVQKTTLFTRQNACGIVCRNNGGRGMGLHPISDAPSSAMPVRCFVNQLFELRDKPRFVWLVRASFDWRSREWATQEISGSGVPFSLVTFF